MKNSVNKGMEFPVELETLYAQLMKASNVTWKKHERKTEQIKFLRNLYMSKGGNRKSGIKNFIWKHFFHMLKWKTFLKLYNMENTARPPKTMKLSRELLSRTREGIRGGCIFTLIGGIIASVAGAASAAAGSIAAGATAVGSLVAGSTVASTIATGLGSGAAAAVGAAGVNKIVS